MTETVTVWRRVEGAADEYGEPTHALVPDVVDGCLVYEPHGADLGGADRPDGVRVTARVQLPDSYMSALPRDALRHGKIALTGRGMADEDRLDIVGSPNHGPDLPTRWSTTIEAGVVDG